MNFLQRLLIPKELKAFLGQIQASGHGIFNNGLQPIRGNGIFNNNLQWIWNGTSFISAPVQQDVNKYINQGYNANSTVYSIVSFQAKKFSSVPWIEYRVKNASKAAQYKALTQDRFANPELMMILKSQAFEEVQRESEVMKLWNRPNGNQTGAEFREAAMGFKRLTGAGPIWANMGETRAKPYELYVLPTQFIQLYPDSSLMNIRAASYTITGELIPINIEDLLYWKYFNPNYSLTGEQLYGQAPLRAAMMLICADNQNVQSQEYLFRNLGVTGLFTPASADVAAAANEQADAIRQTLSDVQDRRGSNDLRSYVNLPMNYHSFGMDAKAMDMIAAHRLSKEDICNVFNHPPALVSLANATDNNFDASVKYLLTNTLYSDLCSLRDQVNHWLYPKFGFKSGELFMDFDITVMPEMQDDMKSVADAIKDLDFITQDEKRQIMKYGELGGAYASAYMSNGKKPIDAVYSQAYDEAIDPSIL